VTGWMAGPDMPHGGMLSAMRARFPDAPEPFLDLSTGINPRGIAFGICLRLG
jgi:hypothetical protein